MPGRVKDMSDRAEVLVETPFGKLKGLRRDGVTSFHRVPYSEPRTGGQRFERPTVPLAWTGIRDATVVAPIPPQNPSRLDAIMGTYPAPQDEDCLHLDIWSPCEAGETAPVLVFIHGGAFMTGGGSMACYNGHDLAKHSGLIVVNITYRLGVFGFMPLPEIGAVNLGLHDQIAALRWIRKAIGAFGGDTGNITLSGQSAGSFSIAAMLATEIGRGLFDRAILMSAPIGLSLRTAEDAQGIRHALMRELGFESRDIDKLRAAPVAQIFAAMGRLKPPAAAVGDVTPPFMPVIDGELIPRDPLLSIADGSANWCETIIGFTREEHAAFSVTNPSLNGLSDEELLAVFERQYGVDGKRMLAAGKARRVPPTSRMIVCDMRGDVDFIDASLAFAQSQASHGQACYVYQFDWQSPMPGLGAAHCLDLPFLFGNLDTWRDAPMIGGADPEELAALARAFQGAFAAFARTGTPDAAGLMHWPEHGASRAVLHFDKQLSVSGWIG